jgi:monoamine oxidase
MAPEPEHHEVIVVGGGVGGLLTARKLIAAGITDVIVLEARPGVGGRIVTTRDNATGQPLFNNFAWRISEANPLMLALCQEELGLALTAQTTPPARNADHHHGQCKHGPYSAECTHKEQAAIAVDDDKKQGRRPPLSDFANSSLAVSASEADFQDRNSGYAGRTSQVRTLLKRILAYEITYIYITRVA